MKTKTLDFWAAYELFRITQKPIPFGRDVVRWFDTKKMEMYPDYKHGEYAYGLKKIEVPIPNGHNPDKLTLAHLQMGENGQEYRLLEEDEFIDIDQYSEWLEHWKIDQWVEGFKGTENYTYRTRKPKGWFLTKKKITLGDCLDDEGNEVYNIPDDNDLSQEFDSEWGNSYSSKQQEWFISNLHKRLLRLEKGTE